MRMATMDQQEPVATDSSEESKRDSGMPGGGQGRKDETGKSGVYPVSSMAGAGGSAQIRGETSWGQGERGAAGYADAGSSEPTTVEGQEAVGSGISEPGGEVDEQANGATA
jgi:hypothetical protein